MSLTCKDCGESLANAFCRCACQREPQSKDERIAELESELGKMTKEQVALHLKFATTAAERSYWQAELSRLIREQGE